VATAGLGSQKQEGESLQEAVIVSAVRTPIGAIGGVFKDVAPEYLAKVAIDGAIKALNFDRALIDEVVFGQTKQTSDAPNIARLAALMADIPEEVPATTVHMQCGSGMQAIVNGMMSIRGGSANVVLAGGVESMSTAPFYIRNARFGVGHGNSLFIDPNIESQPKSQPNGKYGTFSMIQTADTVARQYGVSREAQDLFAFESHMKAVTAMYCGKFRNEIISVSIADKRGATAVIDADECPRPSTSLDKLSALTPLYQGGTVTAGNATGRSDGASALLLMSRDKAEKLALEPMCRILAAVAVGVDPRVMGIGPIVATQKLLQKLEMTIGDFDLVEINEAFAAQVVACKNVLGISESQLNVNGGAIALGHPLGCSGARISTTPIH